MSDKPWYWWAGFHADVEYEGLYALGEFATRDQAITAGMAEMPDVDGNYFFEIVEAQFADDATYDEFDPDEFQPFGAIRNKELIDARAAALPFVRRVA
jgi:hypothetical protein